MSKADNIYANDCIDLAVPQLPFSWLGTSRRAHLLRMRDRIVPWWVRHFYYRHETVARLGAYIAAYVGIGLVLSHLLTLVLYMLKLPFTVHMYLLHVGAYFVPEWKQLAKRISVPRRTTLYREKERAENVLLLIEGYGRLSVGQTDQHRLTVGLIAPGDLFGEEALVPVSERESTFEAVLESKIDVVPGEVLAKSLQASPALFRFITEHLAHHILVQRKRMAHLTAGSVDQRLAWLLLELSSHSKAMEGPHPIVFITHKELATLLGAWRETINAILLRWGNNGIITQYPGCILIKDASRLRMLAEEAMRA